MYICKNCGQTFAERTNFCSNCGSNAIELQNYAQPEEPNFFSTPSSLSGDDATSYSAPAYSEPAYSAPAYSEPAYSAPAYSEPAYSAPAYSEPAYSTPAYSEPAYSTPAYSEPAYSAPAYSEPAYSAQAYSEPAYSAPAYPEAPPSKAPAIVGMICSIIAIFFGLYLIGFSLTSAAYYGYGYNEIDEAAAVCLGSISVFQIPLTVVGLIMSFKAKALKAMGIIGIITGFISVFLWIVSCIVVMSM